MKRRSGISNAALAAWLMIAALPAAGWAADATTCSRSGCTITITIHLAAVGGDGTVIQNWIDDIESVWNGPVLGDGDSPIFGDCDCDVEIEVNFKGWVPHCNGQAAAGNHCIEITPGPARDTAGGTYRAYMRGVSKNGGGITGWWSSGQVNADLPVSILTTPILTITNIHDAAHEAGHMLGLGDDYDHTAGTYGDNIMGQTWGANAKPTQAQIDQIVAANCEGDDAQCPDWCCCGNGEIEGQYGEQCDPQAKPDGCKGNEECLDDCTCWGGWEICGDGTVNQEEEECDPPGDPSACPFEGMECTEDCVCLFKFFWDGDGDGYGSPFDWSYSPDPLPLPYVDNGEDCDDGNPAIHPDATEICGDGIDQNCNGSGDETCPD